MKRADLARAVAKVIREHPERHDQSLFIGNALDGNWGDLLDTDVPVEEFRKYADAAIPAEAEDPDRPVCGTTACVAGWTVILGSARNRKIRLDFCYDAMADGTDIWDRAAKLLGLTEDQATYLFAGYTTREQVLEMLDALPENPRWLPE
jgi:hypothetical protein